MQKQGRTIWVWIILLLAMAGLSVAFWSYGRRELAAGRARVDAESHRPRITRTRPAAGATEVSPFDSVVADITLPTSAGVDPATLAAGMTLTRVGDNQPVETHANTSGAGDALVLRPVRPLDKGVQYQLKVNAALKDSAGVEFVPFSMNFATAKTVDVVTIDAAFEKVPLANTKLDRNAVTSLAIGPEGWLYAASFAGVIYRYQIEPDGQLTPKPPVMTMIENNRGPRLLTGIVFDPASTADAPVLWINSGQMVAPRNGKITGAQDWTGKLSRLSGPNLSVYEDVLVHLPRAYKDHLNFQLCFGGDGALYFNQGSHTSVGDVDVKWGYRPERLLSAAVLRLDVAHVPPPLGNRPAAADKALSADTRSAGHFSLPIDVKTDEGGTYNPHSPNAPLTLYATGVRSGYDLLLHSNGKLYSGINGSAGNEGNTPASPDGKVPAIRNVTETTDDILISIRSGAYYGHPNPTRGEFVLNGGNPTTNADPMEVAQYPVGVKPDPRYQLPAFDFGKNYSPNGLIEWKSDVFKKALGGCILVTRYSDGDDILVLRLNKNGDVAESLAGLDGFTGFTDPLDLVADPKSSNIYVAEYGGQQITLLRPIQDGVSREVRQTIVKP